MIGRGWRHKRKAEHQLEDREPKSAIELTRIQQLRLGALMPDPEQYERNDADKEKHERVKLNMEQIAFPKILEEIGKADWGGPTEK